MSNKNILIIHLSRLGDMIQSLPAAKLLKEEYPKSIITYLGIDDFCILLKGISWIDRLVTIPWQEIRDIMGEKEEMDTDALDRFFQRIPELNEKYDLLINLTHNWSSSYLSEKIKATEKIGRVFSENNEIVVSGDWGKYLFAIARNRKDNLLNLVDVYMGMVGVKNKPVVNFLSTDPEQDLICISRLNELGLNTDRLSVGFQPGANKAMRMWPIENFVRLGEYLVEDLDAQIVLFGSPGERKLAEEFQEAARFPFIDLIGKTTLPELASYFKGIDVLVSNDTGPMHIASAVDTKVVGIFISTAFFSITGSYGPGHVAIQSNYPCCPCLDSTVCYSPLCRESIKPEAVLQGVRLVLSLDDNISGCDVGASIYKSFFHGNGTMRYELINGRTDCFLPWLTSFHDLKAWISQTLWNKWLGLPSDFDFEIGKRSGQLKEIMSDFQKSCTAYKDLYEDGRRLCQKIINEFQKERSNLQLIQIMVESLRQVEARVKKMEGPLSILKEVHECYMAETEICEFPKLAHQFLDKFTALKEIISGFEGTLQKIEVSLD